MVDNDFVVLDRHRPDVVIAEDGVLVTPDRSGTVIELSHDVALLHEKLMEEIAAPPPRVPVSRRARHAVDIDQNGVLSALFQDGGLQEYQADLGPVGRLEELVLRLGQGELVVTALLVKDCSL